MFDPLLLEIKKSLDALMLFSVICFGVSLIAASGGATGFARWGGSFSVALLLFLLWLDGVITVPEKKVDTGYLTVYPFIKTQEHKKYEKLAIIKISGTDQPYSPAMALPVGKYNVRVTLNKYEPHSASINITKGQALNAYIRMVPVLNVKWLDISEKSSDFKKQTQKSLNLLKTANKGIYDIVTRHIDNIRQITIASGTQGMLTRYYPGWEAYPTFNVQESSWKNVRCLDDTIWYASVIAHDSYHAKQYDDAPVTCWKNQDGLSDGLPANWLNENRPERKTTLTIKPNVVCSDPDEKLWREGLAEVAAINHQIETVRYIKAASKVTKSTEASSKIIKYLELMQQECKGMHFEASKVCIKRVYKQFEVAYPTCKLN